jgi:hypothetical protein
MILPATATYMRSVIALFAISALTMMACATSNDATSDDTSEDALTAGAVTAQVEAALMVRNPRERGKTWTITSGNTLSGDWLLQVPVANTWGRNSIAAPRGGGARDADFGLASCSSDRDCGGGACVALDATKKSSDAATSNLCVGHSDSILDEIYNVMTSANNTLDVSTLTAPTGRFLATMRNAMTVLSAKSQPITVRFLVGEFPHHEADPAGLLRDLTRDVKPGSPLRVTVGGHRRTPTSWNHSKIIAVDGREAIIGGMNLWSDHYLDENPVHDVSTHVQGPIAATAQIFVNQLWSVVCSNGNLKGNQDNRCPREFAGSTDAGGGNVKMIGIGRTGDGGQGINRNPADTALIAMMDSARSSIRISQQDIGSVKVFLGGVLPDPYLDAWTRAAIRGVDVTITVSNEGSFGGSGTTDADSYSNGWSLDDLWNGLVRRADELWPDHLADLCAHVHFQTLRASSAATWANGKPLANHAKVIIVDDQAHYVGSQNLYDADLAEFGVIVDDRAATQKFIAEYYDKVDQFSRVTRFRDNRSCR